ncbi:site-specific DNA-methyltransferase [Anoxynatronum buryatiense]|uniref:Adenine-specific DNA-methyltransferase n=1 Tax=Anoxynatronum buryatiense TaxID=489973 RepID=A0AA46AHC9_9CLOT|nr:site-specific DNA-methyltransferase [Anoxynatronum buryatiense]SMP38289.1 adenine-specific DNA-methyltransferase [Anoxynatronum buryatiense]
MNETKLNGKTPNITQENINKLMELFPEVATEGKVDIEKLQQLLGEYAEDKPERYNFTWNGKSRALRISQTPSTGTLRPCKDESEQWDTTQNLYIEGDNLEVLKLLQKSYHGKVKMIYIDPPYNTGGDFVYKDDFKDNIKNYKEITGQVDGEGKNLSTNAETSGRYHTDWLNMLYPRLRLARNLLSDDGVIFISIDDHEVDNLKKVLAEIFGEMNFICQFVWAAGRKNDSKLVSISHEYMLCYSKSKSCLTESSTLWREKKLGLDEIYSVYNKLKNKYNHDYNAIQNELKMWFKSLPPNHPAKNHSHYSSVDKRGIYFPDNISWPGGGGPKYEVLHPNTGKPVKIPSRGWMFSSYARMKELIDDDRVHFGADENSVPCTKSYLKDRETSAPYSVFYKDGRASTKRLMSLMGGKVFDNPKDEEIIKSLIEFTGTSEGIVLDFFSGSATTAHSVMQFNAEDEGNRKFIMVQLPEPCDEKSEAFKAGYKNIAEIGKERIRRAGKKIKEEHGDAAENLDIGFKVLKLDNSNIRRWNPDPDDLQTSLEDHLENFVAGRNELDVVYEIMLKYGLDLTYPVEEYEVAGQKVYAIGFGMLMICLGNQITTKVAEGILNLVKKLEPESARVVCRDNGFASDSEKTNVKEIFNLGGIEEFISI